MKPRLAFSRSLFPISSKGAINPWVTTISVIRPSRSASAGLSTLELCAGAGGQALGFEQAGFSHAGLVEIDSSSCATLRLNRPNWNVIEQDLNLFNGSSFSGIDVISGGLPCPPFSKAGKQLGHRDERNLFPAMINLVDQVRPKAVMIENVRGILDAVFVDYRQFVESQIKKLGYEIGWNLMSASDFGVPQLRPRVVFIALRKEFAGDFCWPERTRRAPKTVGETLYDLMAANGWKGAKSWKEKADEIAPTLVGGSLKHGETRSRADARATRVGVAKRRWPGNR